MGTRALHGGRWLAAGLIVLAVAAGCSTKKVLKPNLPPETSLFVQWMVPDTVDHAVNHVVHLYWFGSDPDGEVAGFDWRFLNLPAPGDSSWRFTTESDSLFAVPAPFGLSVPTFEVRAVDNSGLRDATPARQIFTFTNHAPLVTLISPPGPFDTTYTAVTLKWNASDPDNDAMSFRLWLNGSADTLTTDARSFAILPEAFAENGYLRTGKRTAYVQAVDNGGMRGTPATVTWPVRAPVGTVWPFGQRAPLLILDDVSESAPGNAQVDAIYRDAASRNLHSDSLYSVYRLSSNLTFRSGDDLAATLKLFKGAMWYRDIQTSVSSLLTDYQASIGSYLEDGGAFYVEGLNLFSGLNANGPFGADFLSQYYDSDSLATRFDNANYRNTALWSSNNGSVFRVLVRLSGGQTLGDSLKVALMNGLRGFGVRDTNDVLIWAPENTLSPQVPRRLPVGLSVPQPGGGRALVVTFALRGSQGFHNVDGFLDKVLEQMGVLTPP